ncbi:MAG: hypothetical protein ACI4JK_00445 [Oscillospiraceae bacterium]
MKIIIEGSAEEINGLLESFSKKGNFKSESAEPTINLSKLSECAKDKLANPSCVPKENIRYGKVTRDGLRIGKKLYTFEKGYDIWRYLGEELLIKNDTVFDSDGNDLGKLILI